MNNIPRPEHPNPQWERANWTNLNGTWEFDFDFGRTARDRKLYESTEKLSKEITVPFCPESKLSGIEYVDFIPAVCYRRSFEVSEADLNGRVVLHFGAVDYQTYVYINGVLAGTHTGGYTSFEFDITSLVKVGENTLFVHAEDDCRKGIPSGKQSKLYYSHACDYTRTTGIWQTVWLEKTPKAYIKKAKYYPDIETNSLTVIGEVVGNGVLEIKSSFEGRPTGSVKFNAYGGAFTAHIALTETHLWDLGCGNLYDLELTFGEDTVKSYFGLRNVRLEGMKFMLNNRSVFQRTVLDQGFYPDGIYTAPTEADLINDIVISMGLGFNGARLHEKVFEARFLYHCDKMGYMVWGEYPNWGFDHTALNATEVYLREWSEAMARDFNHPAIIGWCPFNETFCYLERKEKTFLMSTIYDYNKTVDPTRVVIDTSGYLHVKTDVYDLHDYEQDPELFKSHYDMLVTESKLYDYMNDNKIERGLDNQTYEGQPVFMSEYGGIRWNPNDERGWGYGQAPTTEEEFLNRYKGLTDALLDNPKIMGLCYTQLYDIEQEVNGLYTYDRKPKFDPEILKAFLTRKAAIED
ncbi:MAG: beta-galactosidase [Oscillospiraceae bacterium]|nr:beta-galactosidase [Oscillospiraceae bacterium]